MRTIKDLDLNLLRALDALLDERSVTRAAERLNLTQPAMSGMLTRLRDSFDDPLFVRTRRGIIPTRRALELVAPLKQVLGEIESLLQPASFDPASATLTFTIAATDYAQRAVVLPFLSALRQQAPLIRVALLSLDENQLPGQLERGEVDLALLTPESTPPDLHARRLFDEHYIGVMRADHPAASQLPLSLDHFCQLNHALVSYSGRGFEGITDRQLAQLGLSRQVLLSTQSFLMLPEIVRSTDLVALLPARLVTGMTDLLCFEPPLPVPGFTKVAAWHERAHSDVAQRWLRQLLFTLCTDGH